MREDWPIRKLGELSDIAYGYTEKATIKPVGPKFLRITDIQNDSVDWNAVPYCKIDTEEHKKHKLVAGDIVFARTGATTGKSYMVSNPPDAVCASYLIRLRLRSVELLPRFVGYYFNTKAYWDAISTGISGSAQGGFNASKLGVLRIPFPPLPEQQRIVTILDEAFAGLATATANAQKNLKNARELFDTHLNLMFEDDNGWEIKTLDEICTFENGDRGKNYPSRSVRTSKGVPFINAGHLTDDGLDLENLDFISRERFDLLSNGKIKPGDILFCLRGSLGKFASVGNLLEGAIASSLVIIRARAATTQSFLLLYFSSRICADMIAKYSNGAAQPNLSARSLGSFEIPVPPESEQIRIVKKYRELKDYIADLTENYRTKLDEISKLKHTILRKAFSGELTAKAPSVAVSLTSNDTADARRATAAVLALAYERHKRQNRDKSLGHTKEQKILHMVEAEADFNLGRRPTRDAAGPNDFHHMLAAEEWAEANRYFKVYERAAGGYQFEPLAQFRELLNFATSIDLETRKRIERVIDVFIPMDMRDAEVFATIYAAWNNLLIEGKTPTDDEIIRAAREEWHPKKLEIPRSEFVKGLREVKKLNFTPTGRARFVPPPPQGQLPL